MKGYPSYGPSMNKRRHKHSEYEDYAYVLDYMPAGYVDLDHNRTLKHALAQVIGDKAFTLLEVTPKTDLSIYERIFIGKGLRDKIIKINRKIGYEELTSAARTELPYVVEEIIKHNEDRFLRFFNEAPPITNKLHSLELLPGIGKKHMWEILEERKVPFESFEDLKHRVKGLPDPVKMLARRVLDELSGKCKYRLFVGHDRLFR